MATLAATVSRLCAASRRRYMDPYKAIAWPDALDQNAWYFTPELISLYGTPFWDTLGEAQRKRLSQYEALNFFSLNIHGERPLVEGLAQRVYRKESAVITPYLQHFLDEENKHMVYFGGFCTRYFGRVYPEKKLNLPREFLPGEADFLFFAKVLVFEEIVDVYNVAMAKDERLAPIARRINQLHHAEESRHLGFGRLMVAELFQRYAPTWPAEHLGETRVYLGEYLRATWREYYNPDAYRDAGIPDPYGARAMALEDPRQAEHRRQVSARCLDYLKKQHMVEEDLAL